MKRFIFAIFTAEQAGAILDSLCSKTERESEKDKLSADVGGWIMGRVSDPASRSENRPSDPLKVKNPASRRGFFYHTFLKILMMQYVMAEIINGIIATIIFTTMSL